MCSVFDYQHSVAFLFLPAFALFFLFPSFYVCTPFFFVCLFVVFVAFSFCFLSLSVFSLLFLFLFVLLCLCCFVFCFCHSLLFVLLFLLLFVLFFVTLCCFSVAFCCFFYFSISYSRLSYSPHISYSFSFLHLFPTHPTRHHHSSTLSHSSHTFYLSSLAKNRK